MITLYAYVYGATFSVSSSFFYVGVNSLGEVSMPMFVLSNPTHANLSLIIYRMTS